MERIFTRIKNIFTAGITEGHFARGFFLSAWPALYFLIYVLSIPLARYRFVAALTRALSLVPALPILLIFYEAALLMAGIAILLLTDNRKTAIGIFYGVGLSMLVLVAAAVAFSASGVLGAVFR